MSCGGQLGAIQTQGTCWFYSILNGFILSEDGQKILFKKLKDFYDKLPEKDKAYFDADLNAPCPLKAVRKTKRIYFWKFIDNFLCSLSGPRAASLKIGRSAALLKNVNLVGTAARKEGGMLGAHPQLEIGEILEHIGFKMPKDFIDVNYDLSYIHKRLHIHRARRPQFAIMKSEGSVYMALESIPDFLRKDRDYDLMCSSLVIGNSKASNKEQHKWHALACFVCDGKGYIYDSNQRKMFPCDYWNPARLRATVGKSIANFYSFFKNDQINFYGFAYHIFARKNYVKGIAPTCRMKYRTKTPTGLLQVRLKSPTLGMKINRGNFNFLKPAERIALKRRWAVTNHEEVVYIPQATYNAVIKSSESYIKGLRNLHAIQNAGYTAKENMYKNFVKRLRNKFTKPPSPPKPRPQSPQKKLYTFEEAKAYLNGYSGFSEAVRKIEYSRVWRLIPMQQRRILMHWRNTGKWPNAHGAPKNKLSLFNAMREVNALKTAKARKAYQQKRIVNMNMNKGNLKELRAYIASKNATGRAARALKKAGK